MSRVVLWALSTVAVLVLLLGYPTSTSSTMASTATTVARSGREPGVASGAGARRTVAGRTVAGDTVGTQWGPVQVSISVRGGRITDVTVPVRPSGNPRDDEINDFAVPVLVRETLEQQSAQIDMVSGATVTSTGYLQSLQSALDRAGL